jgi:hypothetical protein
MADVYGCHRCLRSKARRSRRPRRCPPASQRPGDHRPQTSGQPIQAPAYLGAKRCKYTALPPAAAHPGFPFPTQKGASIAFKNHRLRPGAVRHSACSSGVVRQSTMPITLSRLRKSVPKKQSVIDAPQAVAYYQQDRQLQDTHQVPAWSSRWFRGNIQARHPPAASTPSSARLARHARPRSKIQALPSSRAARSGETGTRNMRSAFPRPPPPHRSAHPAHRPRAAGLDRLDGPGRTLPRPPQRPATARPLPWFCRCLVSVPATKTPQDTIPNVRMSPDPH